MLAQNARPIEDDQIHFGRLRATPIAMEAQCLKEDGTVDLNVRELGHEEAQFHEGVRRRAGSTLEQIRGDKAVSTLTQEKRERATNAFMERFSMDAIKNKFKAMMRSVFKPSYAEIVAQQMKDIK